MKRALYLCLLPWLCAMTPAQNVSTQDAKIVNSARQKYYSLSDLGLVSFACKVEFDLSTLPPQILPTSDTEVRKQLGELRMEIRVENGKPRVDVNASAELRASASAETPLSVMQSLVAGFWMTWPSKGLNGPLPPFTKWVESVRTEPAGYEIRAKSADGLVSSLLNKEFVVRRIVSAGGQVDENPIYTPTPEGLVYGGLTATSADGAGQKTLISYEIDSALVDGFRLPKSVHMKVNDNLDVRFAMNACTVKRADALLKIAPR
jgi:hypothetical protein